MYQKTKLHAGLQSDCKTCTPDQKPKRRNRDDRPKVERRATTLEGVLRRMISEEIGDDELSKEFRFSLLQKYGMAQIRIDRKVTKPNWKEDKLWRQEANEWFKATKGLVPVTQFKRTPVQQDTRVIVPKGARRTTRPWSQIRHKSQSRPTPLKPQALTPTSQ